MATWEDVRRIALALPETSEESPHDWRVKGKLMVFHLNGYPAVLVRLDRIGAAELGELVVEAWLGRAPKRLVKAYLDESS